MKTRLFGETVDLVEELTVENVPPGLHNLALALTEDGAGRSCAIPILVARGAEPGPVFGITAAIHGDELNGIRIIQELFRVVDTERLTGTMVGCPILNLPGYLAGERRLGTEDLNRVMPGKPSGTEAQVYANRLLTRLIDRFDYLVDLHTASVGRVNSLYVRVNQTNEVAARMADLIRPEIIVHNDTEDGTLRRAAMRLGIPAITVEVGNPMLFQRRKITESIEGILRVLADLKFLPQRPDAHPAAKPILCGRSFWMYSQKGGILDVFPGLTQMVKGGDLVARVSSVYGGVLEEYRAPEDGVVVGRASNPVCETGGRIVHLGALA